MAQRRPLSILLSLCLLAWPVPLFLGALNACESSEPAAVDSGLPPGIFGGAPDVHEPVYAGMNANGGGAGSAGSAGGTTTLLPDPCASVPPGSLAAIDDFEDGDGSGLPEEGRDSFWFTVHDDSPGQLVPDSVFLPVPGGVHGGARAAHVTAAGFSVWGATFANEISHNEGSVRCPYNASRFLGLRLYARGSGQVRVSLHVPEVVDELFSGKCRSSAKEVCYDSHGAWINLTSDWQLYSLKWSQFLQRGFGKAVPFQPATIMSVQFAFESGKLPVDAWFDDVSWDDGSTPPELSPEGGVAGATGAAGSGELGDGGSAAQGGAPSELGAGGTTFGERAAQ